jgi:RNA polymerase sigma-70 factor (ECF subfamily)
MNTESFKQQFLPLHPKLYRVAYSLTGDKQDAEDILQDAYLKLWSRREELTRVQNAEAFCVTLVKNLCFDFLRASRRFEPVENQPLRIDVSPETEAIRKDDVSQVKRLIERLPENQRQVLRLHGIKDCTLEEIEQITGFSAVHVRVLLSRARKFIREQYIQLVNYERT